MCSWGMWLMLKNHDVEPVPVEAVKPEDVIKYDEISESNNLYFIKI